MEKVEFKETIELFLNRSVSELINEVETPRVNFVFQKAAYQLFDEVMKNPFIKKGYWTPNVKKEDIENLRKMNNTDYPIIFVKDHIKFFYYLMEIANNLENLYHRYGEIGCARELLIYIMRRIWLRMGVNDFNNVESFLYHQLEFIKNNRLDHYLFRKEVDYYHNYLIVALSELNRTWDESTRSMSFRIYDDEDYYLLPHILYDIIDNTGYIYAVQNNFFKSPIAEIDKIIYRDYRGNGQPKMVYVMKLFINILKENGITNIKVPTLQVLSYRYHELLSEKEKREFSMKWNEDALNELKFLKGNHLKRKLEEYERSRKWYDHVVEKEDLISKLKTENLINLIYRIVSEDDELDLISDLLIDDTINIKINNKVKKIQ